MSFFRNWLKRAIQDDNAVLEHYVMNLAPIYWVDWMDKCGDPPASTALKNVLFEGGALRDLSAPDLRREVLSIVLQHDPLRQYVLREVRRAASDAST